MQNYPSRVLRLGVEQGAKLLDFYPIDRMDGMKTRNYRRKDLLEFLWSTLIPDLKDSGQYETAMNFTACVLFMNQPNVNTLKIEDISE